MFFLLVACATDPKDAADDTAAETPLEDCAAAELFPTLTADPANSDYPAPELEAGCEGDELVVRSNGIPWYEFVPLTPNELMAVDNEWRVPLEPVAAEAPTEIPLLGVVAFVLVGLPAYGPNEAEFPDPYGDPVYNQIVDDCGGHTGGVGDYHLHAADTVCATMSDAVAGEPSPVIGFALDGYPIYGPMGCLDAACAEVVELRSGWNQIGDPTTYAWDAYSFVASDDAAVLDQCNGRIQPDGTYGYHATSTFPYVLGCYHGVVAADGDTDDGGGGPEVIDCADAEPGMPCCGDDVCDGPETADNCPADCG